MTKKKETSPKVIGEMDGWTITEDDDGVLRATKGGVRPIRLAAGKDADRTHVRTKLFEAMAESDGVASPSSGHPAARGSIIAHGAQIIIHDSKE